jgi:hypothetical protein
LAKCPQLAWLRIEKGPNLSDVGLGSKSEIGGEKTSNLRDDVNTDSAVGILADIDISDAVT